MTTGTPAPSLRQAATAVPSGASKVKRATREDARMSDREFDIVLFGATGFAGKLTAGYLARNAPGDTRIALAGRSAERLERVKYELGERGESWGGGGAAAGAAPALAGLARRTTAVATTVGPYAAYGMPLVRACAQAGTHYADLT